MTVALGDGPGLLAAFRAAVANLEAHVDEVNALNVFPVPDGDTGSNMLATVRTALEEAEGAAGQTAGHISAAMSFGALMGGRGNSGVITSQILNGLAHALSGKEVFDGRDLAHGLTLATETAYAAVKPPVEGTILTVVRHAAEAARAAADEHPELETVLAAAVAAAERSVAETPTLLPVLRDAGVVDAGGQGLFLLLEGALLSFRGDVVVAAAGGVASLPARSQPAVTEAAAEGGFGYETMFLLQPRTGSEIDVSAVRARLESIGESVVVAGDGQAVRVHVHNERPDDVIGYGLGIGILSAISVQNLDQQVSAVRSAGEDGLAQRPVIPTAGPPQDDGSVTPRAPLAVVAVAAGDGLASLLLNGGAAVIVRGGQSANPSTGELLEAIRTVDAGEVIVLPNNRNVVLAAEQAAAGAGRPVHVVPTRNAAEGIVALLELRETDSAADNVRRMTEAGRGVATLQVTMAVRDAVVGGRQVAEGDTIVLDPDEGLVAVDSDHQRAVLDAVAALDPGIERISIYYGLDADAFDAQALATLISGARHDAEVQIYAGGQPHYRYLISAE